MDDWENFGKLRFVIGEKKTNTQTKRHQGLNSFLLFLLLDDAKLDSLVVAGAEDEKKGGDEVVTVVRLDEDSDEGEALPNPDATVNEPKPKREDKVKGLKTYAQLTKTGTRVLCENVLALKKKGEQKKNSRQQGEAIRRGQALCCT